MSSSLHVVLVHDAVLPVQGYGGTERVVWWLAKGLRELGVDVSLACRAGSRCPFATVVPVDFARPIDVQVPTGTIFHYSWTPRPAPRKPYVVTIHGNGRAREEFAPNTVFLTRNHAARHGADCFVYNGVDPAESVYDDKKDRYLLFLAKASWRVKNVKGAIRYARKSRTPLRIVGGRRLLFNDFRGVRWEGTVGGESKAKLVSRAMGLLFPVRWHEPFGIAVVEALLSGTPVLASPWGSLPELVPPQAGRICRSEEEFLDGIARLGEFRPSDCRDWAMETFHYRKMAGAYRALYERVLAGEALNARAPRTIEPVETLFSIPDRAP